MSGKLTVVLIFLTLTVAVVGYRITSDKGTREVKEMAREAHRIFSSSPTDGAGAAPPAPGAVEDRIREWVGAKVVLPRDDRLSYTRAARETIGKRPAAAVHLTFDGDPFLLLIVRPDPFHGGEASSPLFSGSSFLSWEKEGSSFVFWEKDGVFHMLVSNVDLTRTFDLVRQYFT